MYCKRCIMYAMATIYGSHLCASIYMHFKVVEGVVHLELLLLLSSSKPEELSHVEVHLLKSSIYAPATTESAKVVLSLCLLHTILHSAES